MFAQTFINGLEGPYTLVLIDGCPLLVDFRQCMACLESQLLIRTDRIKGPLPLYGSEAVEDWLISLQKIQKCPFSADALPPAGVK
jgi:hypothetical protein